MTLLRLIKGTIFVTALSLVYINMQLQIFDLAYQGKNKEKTVRDLAENNGNVTYDILKLKSANHIGYQMLDENSDMRFLDNTSIVSVEAPESLTAEQTVVALSQPVEKSNFLLGLFSSRAEAKPQTE